MVVACSLPSLHTLIFIRPKHIINVSIPPLGAVTQQPKSMLLSVMINKKGPFKDHLMLSIDGDLRVCHFNIEKI